MKTHQNSICGVACAVILASSAFGRAQALFSDPGGFFIDTGLFSASTVGATFTVGSQAVTVTALGVYDSNQDGLIASHAVGIWSSGSLIGNTVVPAGTGATLQGSYRYGGITTLTLSANTTYTIGAFFASPSTGYDPIGTLGTWSFDPAFSAAVPYYYSGDPSTFMEPTTGYAASELWAANMLFTVVPEPSSLILTAASGLLILRRRRF
jgi:hypothetical protein